MVDHWVCICKVPAIAHVSPLYFTFPFLFSLPFTFSLVSPCVSSSADVQRGGSSQQEIAQWLQEIKKECHTRVNAAAAAAQESG